MLKSILFVLAAFSLLFLSACEASNGELPNGGSSTESRQSFTYSYSDEAVFNPLMGFAPQADYMEAVGNHTLVYIEVLWRDIEPQEGVYDFSVIEQKNYLSRWRSEGKHAVLRFICDKPSGEDHMDIPDWLYEKTGDGTRYAYDEDHKGYSPNYANNKLIKAHAQAIEALGNHFNDTFVSYVELGSLGHWGEWHVNYEKGIVRLPGESTRELYVLPYLTAFPHAKLLMRRPFNVAKKYELGLFDDTAGNPIATERWLDWIQNGGDYSQADEKNALAAMPDAWKTAPIGGEFNSDIPLVDMITGQLDTTLSLLKASHTTFLGPHFPNGLRPDSGKGNEEGIQAIQKIMGYRLWVREASFCKKGDGYDVSLTFKNSGNAPLYFDWNVYIYCFDSTDRLIGKFPLNIRLSSVLPETEVSSSVHIQDTFFSKADYVAVGIEDPLTAKPSVSLTMTAEDNQKAYILWRQSDRKKQE